METIKELRKRIDNLEEQQKVNFSPYVERNLIKLRKRLDELNRDPKR